MSGHKFKSGKRGRPAFDASCITCGVIWSKHEAATVTTAQTSPATQPSVEVEPLDDEDDTPVHRDVIQLAPDEQTAIDEYLERLHPGFINRRADALQRV